MPKKKNQTPAPGMMLIMKAVALAAHTTTADLLSGSRKAVVTRARAAVFKLATAYGYPKDDIAFFLDRNRKATYNYEYNINGFLRRDLEFKRICISAKKILGQHPHRDLFHPSIAPKVPEKGSESTAAAEPEFHDTKLKLGWFFTAEENRRAWHACREAEKFFETYGKAPTAGTHKPKHPVDDTPKELPTADAIEYLNGSNKILMRGVELGHLHRFRKPGKNSYWYHTDELEAFRTYLAKNKNYYKRN